MEDYEVVKTLGSGAFGSVNKVVRRVDRKAFAMKKVQIGRMEEREVADALNECLVCYARAERARATTAGCDSR